MANQKDTEVQNISWAYRIKNKLLRKIAINISLLFGYSKSSLKAILLAFIVGGIILLALGYQPLAAYGYIFQGAFVGGYSLSETLVIATPLILVALSYAMAYRCGVINLGAEGQLYLGAVASGTVAIYTPGPGWFVIPLALIAGFTAGALWGLIAGWLKVRFGASELITTIMLNYVGINLVGVLLAEEKLLRAVGSVEPLSEFIPVSARLPVIVPGTRITIAFLIAIAAVLFYFYFLWKTTVGYETRMVGRNKTAAEYCGIQVNKRALLAMIIAGGFAGLAGTSEVLGTQFRIYSNLSKGMGFDGIAIALVGANAPLGILFSGIFFGALRSGAGWMQVMVQTPVSVVDMLMALIIIFITAPRIFSWVQEKLHLVRKQTEKDKGGEVS